MAAFQEFKNTTCHLTLAYCWYFTIHFSTQGCQFSVWWWQLFVTVALMACMSFESAPRRFFTVSSPLLHLYSCFCQALFMAAASPQPGFVLQTAVMAWIWHVFQLRMMLALLLTLSNCMPVGWKWGQTGLCVLSRLRATNRGPNAQRAGVAGSLHRHHQTTTGGVFIFPGDTEGPGGSE